MQARMKNPAMVLPGAMHAIGELRKAMSKGGVPQETLELVHLRASQINGCSACVDAGARAAKKAGETDERLWALAVWRDRVRGRCGRRRAMLGWGSPVASIASRSIRSVRSWGIAWANMAAVWSASLVKLMCKIS